MSFFGLGKPEPDRAELARLEEERRLLFNLQRGTVLGEFVTLCRTDYVQQFSDPWISRFDYHWTEYLLLLRELLTDPNDLTRLVFEPNDLAEVYYVVVPPMAPNFSHLSPQGRADYELYPGYEGQVNAHLQRDYSSLPRRSVFHSVDPQGAGWNAVVDDVLSGRKHQVELEYEGTRYTYSVPRDKKEAEAGMFMAYATRRGAYPMEESLSLEHKYDVIPAIPDGVTGRVFVREFVADPRQKPPWQRLSFQRTEIPPGSAPADHPLVMSHISLGDDLPFDASLIRYLQTRYVQLDRRNPSVKIQGYY